MAAAGERRVPPAPRVFQRRGARDCRHRAVAVAVPLAGGRADACRAIDGHQFAGRAGDRDGHLRHVYGGPHQASPGPSHRRPRPPRILFVGYQSQGTLGRQILDGQPGGSASTAGNGPGRAEIGQIQGISGHADRAGPVGLAAALHRPARQLFVTHGEQQSARSLAHQVRAELGWNVTVPQYEQVANLE